MSPFAYVHPNPNPNRNPKHIQVRELEKCKQDIALGKQALHMERKAAQEEAAPEATPEARPVAIVGSDACHEPRLDLDPTFCLPPLQPRP